MVSIPKFKESKSLVLIDINSLKANEVILDFSFIVGEENNEAMEEVIDIGRVCLRFKKL